MTATLEKVEIWMAGCWLDGHFGWHNSYRVVLKAEEFGFIVPEEYREAMDNYCTNGNSTLFIETDGQWEAVHGQGELSDQATDFLQERAPEGYQFVWDMGEFMLLTDEEASYV
ncbi:hypothetical protein [Streptomyces sp. NPDC005281]|uniref:hypothetical protein n=1 Tax=Streptomyces sp. NPDC005281 TaxID=3155712 RepID=UPI0033A38BFE